MVSDCFKEFSSFMSQQTINEQKYPCPMPFFENRDRFINRPYAHFVLLMYHLFYEISIKIYNQIWTTLQNPTHNFWISLCKVKGVRNITCVRFQTTEMSLMV